MLRNLPAFCAFEPGARSSISDSGPWFQVRLSVAPVPRRLISACTANDVRRSNQMQSLKVFGLVAAGALFVIAAPVERAQAVSLINPGAAQSVQDEVAPTTEVRWH